MELIKIKRIPEIDKSYYKTTKIICDKCNKEIGENDEYLEVNYMEKHYDDELSYKHFCEKCMKDSMYEMFINNHYTNFHRYIFNKDKKWIEFDEYDMQRYGFKEERLWKKD